MSPSRGGVKNFEGLGLQPLFRCEVSCATLLERWPTGWRLDRRESTRRALKYRRGEGEIINHNGHGWWDPQSSAKGDVFDLVQHLDPTLNLGQARKEFRRLVGVAPAFHEALRPSLSDAPDRPVTDRWKRRPRLRPGSAAWSYFSDQHRIPASIVTAAAEADIVRDGPFRSAWFAHTAPMAMSVTSRSTVWITKARLGAGPRRCSGSAGQGVCGLAVTEAPIDALSLAAIDGRRTDTLYLAPGGGIGPGTVSALQGAVRVIAAVPSARLVAATDANRAGDRCAERLTEIAAETGIPVEQLRPKGATFLIPRAGTLTTSPRVSVTNSERRNAVRRRSSPAAWRGRARPGVAVKDPWRALVAARRAPPGRPVVMAGRLLRG